MVDVEQSTLYRFPILPSSGHNRLFNLCTLIQNHRTLLDHYGRHQRFSLSTNSTTKLIDHVQLLLLTNFICGFWSSYLALGLNAYLYIFSIITLRLLKSTFYITKIANSNIRIE